MWNRIILLLFLSLLIGSCGNHVCTDDNRPRPPLFPHAMT